MNRDLIRAVWHRHREPLVMLSVVQLPSIEDSHESFQEHVGMQLQVDAQNQVHEETHAPD
jgi:succinate dehydrogenase / fumarate reductase iron-sulfur subunit